MTIISTDSKKTFPPDAGLPPTAAFRSAHTLKQTMDRGDS